MSTKVDSVRIDELAAEFKQLSKAIEAGEINVNKDVKGLISETNSQYDEYYVRSTTNEIDRMLSEIRTLTISITQRLNNKHNILKHAAERYRNDENAAQKIMERKVEFSLASTVGGALSAFFKAIGNAISSTVGGVIGLATGKERVVSKEASLNLPVDIPPLKNNLTMNPKVYSEDVKKLQQKLKDLGYSIEVDGYFGKQTLAVVNDYKNKYGLGNTGEYAGVVGNQTWLWLFGGLTGELKLDPAKYSEQVRMAQIRFKDLGYNIEVTGYFDEKTLKAVNEFKTNNKLGNTGEWEGVIGPQTWGVLFGAGSIGAIKVAAQDINNIKLPDSVKTKYPSQAKFIESIIPVALRMQKETGVPWQVIVAQTCLETGYGSSMPEGSNNLHGIKYTGSLSATDKYVLSWTKEHISASQLEAYKKQHPELEVVRTLANGKIEVRIKAAFCKFATIDESFEGYKKVITNKYFSHAIRSASDPIEFIKDIQSELPGENHPKYATDVDYVSKITSIMQKFALLDFKVPEVSSTTNAGNVEKPKEPAVSTSYKEHVVKSGDTLSAIAKKYGTTVEELVRLNNIKDKNKISVNQVLKIPNGSTSTVPNTTPPKIETPKKDDKPAAPQTGKLVIPKDAWVPITPGITSKAGQRDPDLYNKVIDQFDVANHDRYKKRNGFTYCNIFAWDVMKAMGVELPQRVDAKTKAPREFPDVKGTVELNANGMADWLEDKGAEYGWVEVSAEEAQAAANRGEPTVAVWNNPGGIGHFQVVRPTQGNDKYNSNTGVYVAQAGGSNFSYATASTVYGKGNAMNKLKYYIHK